MIKRTYAQLGMVCLLLGAMPAFSTHLAAASSENNSANAAQEKSEITVFSLGNNAFVDSANARILSANAAGKASAHALLDGKLLWQSNEISVPVYLQNDVLYAIGAVQSPGVGQLLMLDARSGAVKQRVNLRFPDKVFPNPVPGPARQFEVFAKAQGSEVMLYWQYRSQALKAALEEGYEEDHELLELSGSFAINSGAEGEVLANPSDAELVLPFASELFGDERMPKQSGRQFQSVDSTVVSLSQAQADNTFGTRYQWRLLQRTNAEELGKLNLPVSSAPFAVIDATVFVQLPAMAFAKADGGGERIGHHIQAIRLSDQKPLFRIIVLAPRYQGPMPP